MKSKCLMFAVLAAAGAQQVPACDLCAVYSATEAGGGIGRGFYSGLALQYTHLGTLQQDGQKIPNADDEHIHSLVSQVFAGYNFNDRFGVQMNLPLIYRSYAWSGYHSSDVGPGDLSLIGNFAAVRHMEDHTTFAWNLTGGVKLPTGDTSWLGPRGNVIGSLGTGPLGIGGHDLTLGSGSVDGVIGTGLSARWHRWFVTANTQYALRTKGDFDHQFADDLTWSGGPGYYLALNTRYTLALQCLVSGEHKGKDTDAGAVDPDTAETIVYVGPQVNFTRSDKFSAQMGVDLPVSVHNSGVQVVPSYRVRAALNWRF